MSAEVFNHMAQQHGFSVGLPDNLVYTSEFLQLLQSKLESLQCLYCEKTFRDRPILKEHMRKKLHKRINSKNAAYDKFYIINYLELGKNWEILEHEDAAETEVRQDDGDTGDSNSEWEDWREEGGAQTVCLFCPHKSTLPQCTIHHMKDTHQFDLIRLKQTMVLNFYQQVKLINYIRRQMHQYRCIQCQERFTDHDTLMTHMQSSGHLGQVLDTTLWDQPQYYFPTYEDDNLLCVLDVDDDENCETRPQESDHNRETVVIAEDVPVHDSILAQKDIRMKIIMS
ncbi:zinc finger protein 277 [Lamellibrachia satsuma]|nr:zinc finger protein 277 [Lamellibrachia satsuma]